jgi:8-amino-7-oxononanoate synthase
MVAPRIDDARAAGVQTFAEILAYRAAHHPDRVIFRHWVGDGATVTPLTYGELAARSAGVAARLADARVAPGDRVLLLVPPGLDYIAAFFGTLVAGAIAVPAFPPHPRRRDDRVGGVIVDCAPRVALVDAAGRERVTAAAAHVPGLDAVALVDVPAPGAPTPPLPAGRHSTDAVALLQYTSGSTADPRGVVLTHRHLLANAAAIHAVAAHQAGDEAVFWLPPYHDMGLIGGVLQPVYGDVPTTVMAPATFLQRPARWLEALARFRATTTGAPDFAYRLCVERIPAGDRDALDLSAWRTAFNGAEPVRAETITRFTQAFAGANVRRDLFVACYGLAEATLLVAARRVDASVVSEPVGCGAPVAETTLQVVDPDTGRAAAPGEHGEIWVAGPAVATRYWRDDAPGVFAARGADTPDGAGYLRTGDLGTVTDDGIVITGRGRELIIVGGRNHFPDDLERTVERAHPHVRPNAAVAFGVTGDRGEALVVVAEVVRRHTAARDAEVMHAIRDAVGRTHDILPVDVVLVPPHGISRTSSGKRRRLATRDAYLGGALPARVDGGARAPTAERPSTAEVIGRWIAAELGVPAAELTAATELRGLGLDSVGTTHLLLDLEAATGKLLEPSVIWAQRTVGDLVAYVDAAPAAARASEAAGAGGADVSAWPEVREFVAQRATLERAAGGAVLGGTYDGIAGRTLSREGVPLVNFASYNYLGLNGHPAVLSAAARATARWGTSTSASRLVSGERAVHADLERALAGFIGVEAALAFVGGHATNTGVIPMLVGPGDLVLGDASAHNSALLGAAHSGARRVLVPHNDLAALDDALRRERPRARRALILVEGLYSAEGDLPDLPALVELKRRHDALLMVDEAHSLGVLGATGRGIAEETGVRADVVDVWMGTLSKALASCGGYVAGRRVLIDYLRWNTPGFVFSVGLPPANAAAALAALEVMRAEPERVARLRANARAFVAALRAAGVPVGDGAGAPVVPVAVGDTSRALLLVARLAARGVNVAPLIPPAVPPGHERLRFFISADHRPDDVARAATAVAEAFAAIVAVPASSGE